MMQSVARLSGLAVVLTLAVMPAHSLAGGTCETCDTSELDEELMMAQERANEYLQAKAADAEALQFHSPSLLQVRSNRKQQVLQDEVFPQLPAGGAPHGRRKVTKPTAFNPFQPDPRLMSGEK
eukprot:CAMPEP_0179297770 /NCGR_PEP_ID=MMETSP0797-20121207/45643_1 /TAXON_ID=47934 /ORGANISM="Dinophysis acuminata, Strain DAEP01" /LENGTH=122 /DNA_ID=CAMNT_0021007125 /DNA_START=107 /DNA_END=475 /DNA_ORIENTATION=-